VIKDSWNITFAALIWRRAMTVRNQRRNKIIAAAILQMVASFETSGTERQIRQDTDRPQRGIEISSHNMTDS
jgi:hypothetical protein